MLSRILMLGCVLLSIAVTGYAQPKKLQAVRASQSPKLDGKLDDEAWQNAPVATDFVENFPDFGKASPQRTEVRLVYTDDAVYIGAYLYDTPALIKKQLTQRDKEQFKDVDNFGVSFDTYKDQQNAFQFMVTSVNVQSDIRISAATGDDNDGPDGFDYNWDAVWDSRTSFVDNGWIAEIKIPFSAIRFSKKNIQDWGINFSRFVRRDNATYYWNPVNPKTDGLVNQYGTLEGLQNIEPPLRLSFLPYVSLGYQTIPTNNGTINTFIHNGGMDVKYGVNESFTLDMTLVPDFGQVQSDNVILNLTPYEQKFTENRPFFTEGTELFNKAGIFYSRRVGSIPGGYYDALQMASDSGYTVEKNPALTQLYNATKFSGRTKHNLGIGVFNAVTAPMYATLQTKNGENIKLQTEPLANYNVIVLDQSLKNRSYVTFTNTNVTRAGNARDANVTALNLSTFDKKNMYNFQWDGKFSYVTGDDPHNGFSTGAQFSKVSGKWQWGLYNQLVSKEYDPNDLGFLRAPNEFTSGAVVSYTQFNPNKVFNYRNYELNFEYSNLFEPFKYSSTHVSGSFLHVFKNFWDITYIIEASPSWEHDYFELRTPGKFVKKPPFGFMGLNGSTDSRKKWFANYFVGFADFSPIPKDPFYLLNFGLRYRFSAKFSTDLQVEKQDDKGNVGFALFDDITGDPVFSLRRVEQFTTTANAIYNFKARMSLTMRARHYWSKVHYTHFYNVDDNGDWLERPYIYGRDDNFNLFNMDMFFTWDFRLGSRLIVAWKNALGPDAYLDGEQYPRYGKNLTKSFSVPHSNEVSVKFVYYIDYLQLKRKDK